MPHLVRIILAAAIGAATVAPAGAVHAQSYLEQKDKSGFVLLQVKGDPLCQLRSWTVSEDYQGGGRYQPATGATVGYVRWQACKS